MYLQVLKENGYNHKLIGIDAEVLEIYVKRHSPLRENLDGRLTIVS